MAGGEGSVVTGRFITREANELARVTFAQLSESVLHSLQAEGREPTDLTAEELNELAKFGLVEIETLEGTDRHPIWSEDRQDWVPLGQLQVGETLRAAGGLAVALSVAIHNHLVPVYNIEVLGQLVYQVGTFGLLVHNNCYDELLSNAQKLYPKKAFKMELHHIVPKYLGGAEEGVKSAIDAAYHQLITNEFRRLHRYGPARRSLERLTDILQQVYDKFSLP